MLYEKIKALAKENKISISELEKRMGIAQGSICKWGSGDDGIKPSYDKMISCAKILGTTVEELVG